MAKSHKKKSGKKRPPSPWVKHCMKWSKDHNMKYGDVLSDPDCKAAYQASKDGSSKGKSKKSKKSKKSRK